MKWSAVSWPWNRLPELFPSLLQWQKHLRHGHQKEQIFLLFHKLMVRSFASLSKMESSHIGYSAIIKSLNRGESFIQWQYSDHKIASFKKRFPAKLPGVGEWVNLLHVSYIIIVTGTLKDNHSKKSKAEKSHIIKWKLFQMTVFTSCPALKTFPSHSIELKTHHGLWIRFCGRSGRLICPWYPKNLT